MNALQKIKDWFSSKDNSNQGRVKMSETHNRIRVFCPNGLIPYFFKNVVIVAKCEREARNQYYRMLKKELKLRVADSMQKDGTN